MAVFITKEVGTIEHHVTCYLTHKALWKYIKNEGLEDLLQFLLSTFCQLYKNVTKVARATLVSLLVDTSKL